MAGGITMIIMATTGIMVTMAITASIPITMEMVTDQMTIIVRKTLIAITPRKTMTVSIVRNIMLAPSIIRTRIIMPRIMAGDITEAEAIIDSKKG